MKRILLIHFQVLEKYPPVQNLLNVLGENKDLKIFVLTHAATNQPAYEAAENCTIYRLNAPTKAAKLGRLMQYLYFSCIAFFKSLKWKPNAVLYYETDSAMAGLASMLASRKSKLFIHYHEYNSPTQYREGMLWIRLANHFEKAYLWSKATWISHTNEQRLRLFKQTYGLGNLKSLQVLANYPPKKWLSIEKCIVKEQTLVYVGSLGLENFYIKELLQLMKSNKQFTLDIYGHNISASVKEMITASGLNSVNIKPGVPYHEVPIILNQYDVGLILYKPFNDNFRLNETNKLFEYLSYGLEVWYPQGLEAIEQFHQKYGMSQLRKLDFTSTEHLVFQQSSKEQKSTYPKYFVAETEFEKLLSNLNA